MRNEWEIIIILTQCNTFLSVIYVRLWPASSLEYNIRLEFTLLIFSSTFSPTRALILFIITFFYAVLTLDRLHYCPVDNSTPVVVTIALLGNKTDPPGFYYYNYYYYYIHFFLFRHRSLSFRVSYRFCWETFRGLQYDLRALHNIMYTICILWVCV